MKLKSAIKFRYKRNLKLMGLFYMALAVITIVVFIGKRTYPYSNAENLVKMDAFYYLSAILSFFIGFLSFKDEQKFFIQNGSTREQCHISFLGYLPISIVFALAERLFTVLFCIAAKTDCLHFLESRFIIENRSFFADVAFETIALMCFLSFGYLISIIICRVKPVYIAMSIIVIAFAMFADYSINNMNGILPIFAYVPSLIYFGSAFNEFVSFNFVVSHILTACILLSLSHILSLGVSINGKEKH